MKTVCTRVAPSPTGYPHIGTIYQALFDFAWARKNNGRFLIRIEDTDQSRFVEDAEEALYKAFKWFGLEPNESPLLSGAYAPYKQSQRLNIYKQHAKDLVHKGHAYYCFCSQERLDQIRADQVKNKQVPMYDKHCRNLSEEEVKNKLENGEKHVIRMKIPENQKIIVKDLVRGDLEFDSNGIDDQVLIKSDGFATYHLAVVVDDHLMQVSHVIRGPEWISSFPKHKLLYDYFGWEMPVFVHTPMITNMDGSKLSKRNGHSSVDWYRRKGFLHEAIINFISLLGWSHPDGKEIFPLDEFISKFELKDMSALSPKFDLTKLEWMNGQYLQSIDNTQFLNKLVGWIKYCIEHKRYLGAVEYETKWIDSDYISLLKFLDSIGDENLPLFSEIIKTRIKKFEDLLEIASMFFHESDINSELLIKFKSKDEVKAHLSEFAQFIEKTNWSLEGLKNLEKKMVEKATAINWKVNEIFYPIRIAVGRSTVTPPLFESIYLLGKEKTLERLKTSIE